MAYEVGIVSSYPLGEMHHGFCSVFIASRNSVGVQILASPAFPRDSRSSSPDMIYMQLVSIAQEMNLSSSGSLQMLISLEGMMTLNSLNTSSMSCCFILDGYFSAILSMTSLYSSHISGEIYASFVLKRCSEEL